MQRYRWKKIKMPLKIGHHGIIEMAVYVAINTAGSKPELLPEHQVIGSSKARDTNSQIA